MKTKTILITIFAFILFCATVDVKAQQNKFKALFIYNFTKYISWPEFKGNEFVICVLDNNELYKELTAIGEKKKVGVTPLKIKNIKYTEEAYGSQILFISKSKAGKLKPFYSSLDSKNILIVTEFDNACLNGSGINIVSKEGKMSFEISKNNIHHKGLIVNNQLVTLGKSIE